MIKYPDYDNSILALCSSVLSYYGVKTNHRTLSDTDVLLEKNYKNVVVMLFDGMGTAILEKYLDELNKRSFFRRNFKKTISSVFPPTTTAATMTMETGLSPIEHGWLGWSLYFSEINQTVSIFPNTISGSNGAEAADYNVARRYISFDNVYEKIEKATAGDVKAFCVSPFSSFHSQSSQEICDTVVSLCSESGRKYIYTYWHQPDYDMHDLGTNHRKITENIELFDSQVEKMCSALTDTLVIVTADHGLIDTDWRFLPDFPEMEACFIRRPSIESRALTFFIKDGMHKVFETEFQNNFGEFYKLMTKREVLNMKLFGDGIPHPKSLDFIGDYLAAATGTTSIESFPSQTHDLFRAAHAGLTEDEMNIPLIVFEC